MTIDWKLFRTLVLAGVSLIVVHELVSNWAAVKAGFSGARQDHASR
jgi:hypothetical protein